ncbi:MAG: hypothetical protein R8G34_02485 [Paracoccaceae bacterium]|nr:hypothetical protein [Paracoccaceae bacterium]
MHRRPATKRSPAVEATARTTSSGALEAFAPPRSLVAFRQMHSGISIELVLSNWRNDLTGRNAEIAIGHAYPDPPDRAANRIANF